MNTDTHPETEDLRAYLGDVDAPEFSALRLHLASCQACRDEITALNAVERFYSTLEQPTDDAAQQLISDYVDGNLQGQAHTNAAALIHDNDSALKAALHYASHSAAMSAALDDSHDAQRSATSAKQNASKTGLFGTGLFGAIGRWLDMRPPVWAVVPATAFAVAALVVFLQPYLIGQQEQYRVASYQDNPVMQFRKNDELPGIGFFSKAGRSSKAYNKVQVEVLDESRLRIIWPAVDKAVQYTMRLQMFNQNQKISLGEITTKVPTATFETTQLNSERRYEWILSGKTDDEMTFYSSGGFVISKTDQAGL